MNSRPRPSTNWKSVILDPSCLRVHSQAEGDGGVCPRWSRQYQSVCRWAWPSHGLTSVFLARRPISVMKRSARGIVIYIDTINCQGKQHYCMGIMQVYMWFPSQNGNHLREESLKAWTGCDFIYHYHHNNLLRSRNLRIKCVDDTATLEIIPGISLTYMLLMISSEILQTTVWNWTLLNARRWQSISCIIIIQLYSNPLWLATIPLKECLAINCLLRAIHD